MADSETDPQMTEINATAAKLGELVAAHPAIKKFADAQKALSADDEANRLLSDFDRKVQVMARNEQMGQPVTPAERQAVESLQAKLASNLKVKAFSIAQVDMTDFLRKVSQVWQRPVAEAQGPAEQPSAQPAGPRLSV